MRGVCGGGEDRPGVAVVDGIIFDAWAVRSVRDFGGEGRVVLPVGEEGHDDAERGAYDDVVPVV